MDDNNNPKTTVRTGGIGVSGLLGVVFIVLKLCKVIAWSWWWVLAPFWIPMAIYADIALVLFICMLFSKN